MLMFLLCNICCYPAVQIHHDLRHRGHVRYMASAHFKLRKLHRHILRCTSRGEIDTHISIPLYSIHDPFAEALLAPANRSQQCYVYDYRSRSSLTYLHLWAIPAGKTLTCESYSTGHCVAGGWWDRLLRCSLLPPLRKASDTLRHQLEKVS